MVDARAPERPTRGPWLRLVPERRLAVSLALAAPLWLVPGTAGRVLAVGALALIAACIIVDMFRLPPARSIAVTRTVPATVGIGDTVDGSYEIAPRWAHALDIHVYDEIPAALRGGVGVASVRLAPHATGHFDFTLTGMKRGRAELGRIGVRVTTPIGFLAGRHWVSPGDEMLVAPSVTGVRRYRLLAMQHRLDAMGVRALARKGDGQGFAGLRDYALGDDPRHIDWKATARRARLTTREFTIERSQTVFTLIDAGRGMTQLAGEYSRFEHALSAAVVLSDIAATAGDRVGTLVFDDEIRAFVPANRSRGALQAVRDALVPVVATTIEPDYAAAFRFLATHQRKRALVVFFTDVIDLRASQSLMAHVARSAARHLALVVALRNDTIFDAAIPASRAVAASALYERAAAEELILAREEALERMRRAGVIVLDVSPRVMTSSVINRYLELKARGAI